MSIQKLQFSWAYLFFVLIVMVYGIVIPLSANFSVIDDHGLLDTLLIGREMPLFVIPEIGRFFPLNGYEYSLISNISASPFAFYLYNAFQFFVIVFLLYKILESVEDKNKYVGMLLIVLLMFSPGFVTGWLRLFVPERSELFFLVVFLFFFIKYQKEQKTLYLLLGLISANIALYYKEPAFLMLGSFAFFHIVLGWKEINFKQKLFDYLLMFSAFVFALVYFFVVYIHKGDTLYGTTTVNPVLQLAKTIFNYSLHDPLLIFILLPLVMWRVYAIIKNRRPNHLFDSMLFSSSIYILVFLKLNMFAHHYLLPAYAFGLVAIAFFVFSEQIYKKILFKVLIGISVFFTLLSSFPAGLHLFSHYKNVPNNFQNTLTFLDAYIDKHSKEGNKISIFLDGINRNGGEVHHSFIKYLEYKGLNSNQFDIKSDQDDNGILPIVPPKNDANYTIWKQTTASAINEGDLIVVIPYTTNYIGLDKKELEEMSDKYELIYHANSFLEIPNIGIKSILKDFFAKYGKAGKDSQAMLSRNIYQLPLDFYVFRKKR